MLIFAIVFLLIFAPLAFVILRKRENRVSRLVRNTPSAAHLDRATVYKGPRFNVHGREIA